MTDIEKQTPIENSTGCSIYQTSKISIMTIEGHYCNFCYEICKKAELPILHKTFETSEKCDCNHNGIINI